MENCIFCKIAKGEIPSFNIFENDDVLAFLDINPLTKGHALVIPKAHFENIFDIDEDVLKKVIISVKHLAGKIKDSLHAQGIRVSQSNGQHAGQAIFHFHMHIIPRYQDDGISMSETMTAHPPQANFEELKKLAEDIKNNL